MSDKKRLEAIERVIQMWIDGKMDTYTAMIMVSILSEEKERRNEEL